MTTQIVLVPRFFLGTWVWDEVTHSGSAIPGTLVLDQAPERVDHMVWVNTAPSPNGGAFNADFAGEALAVESICEEEPQE